MTDLPDWAKDKAREWLRAKACSLGHIYNAAPPEGSEAAHHDSLFGGHVASLAALLVEVGADDLGSIWDRSAAMQKAAVLAEVCRVVADVQKSIWGAPSDTGSAVTLCCDEILSRLEKLG